MERILRYKFIKGPRRKRWLAMRKRNSVGISPISEPSSIMLIGTDEDEAITDGQSAIIFEG